MTDQKSILITRPKEDAGPFAKAIEALGLKPLVEPMMRIKKLEFTLPGPENYQGVIFTSANAVRMLPEGFRPNITAYCVSERTAAEAKVKGFRKIITGGGTVADLAALLTTEKAMKGKKLLHIRGEHVSASDLANAGVEIDERIAYRAQPMENLSAACVSALKEGNIEAVTFFSTRTALTFFNLIEKARLADALTSIKLLCISNPVLQSVRPYKGAETYAAPSPDQAGMLSLIKAVCGPSNDS